MQVEVRVRELHASFVSQGCSPNEAAVKSLAAIAEEVKQGGKRHLICVTLAEGETLRRIIHIQMDAGIDIAVRTADGALIDGDSSMAMMDGAQRPVLQ